MTCNRAPLGHSLHAVNETGGPEEDPGKRLMRGQPATVWCLDTLCLEGDRVLVDGWALAPAGSKPALSVNGVRLPAVFGIPRPDLARLMAFDERAPTAGFRGDLEGAAALAPGRESLELHLCDDATLRPFNPAHAFYWPLRPPGHALPDAARRRRVHGDEREEGFVISGYSTYRKLTAALAEHSRAWEDFDGILDWGCGCGRVHRYLPERALARLTGADIDADNIEWCRRSLPGCRFHCLALLPPAPLPEAGFDLVIAVSVFTHLREAAQHAWLGELARVTRRGGLVLATIHGPAAGARANLSREQADAWGAAGFLASGLSVDLKGAIADETYYVNSLHSHDYVRREWGRHFEILRIVDCTIANHQDLVVMRRR